MNFRPAADTTTWAYAGNSTARPRKKTDIIYAIAQPIHRTGILEVLAKAFVNEPSTTHQSIGRPSYENWYRFTEFYIDECTTNSLSAVALDAHNGHTVVGALITRDFLTPPDRQCEAYVARINAFGPIAAAVDLLDRAWFKRHPDITVGQTGRVVDLWMGGVRPGYQNRGIATKLGKMSLAQAARAGFDYAIAECTGAYSQHLVKATGFTAVHELAYADFLWKGEAIFKNVAAPHNKWAIYEKKL